MALSNEIHHHRRRRRHRSADINSESRRSTSLFSRAFHEWGPERLFEQPAPDAHSLSPINRRINVVQSRRVRVYTRRGRYFSRRRFLNRRMERCWNM